VQCCVERIVDRYRERIDMFTAKGHA